MIRLTQLIILMTITAGQLQAQDPDRFRISSAFNFGFMPTAISGVSNDAEIFGEPIYRKVDTTGFSANINAQLGVNIPLYRTREWSVGVKLNAGVGFIAGIKANEGLSSLALDFPQFGYFRHYGGAVDFAVLLGYKYTRMALPYQLMLIGGELFLSDHHSVRLYGSLFRYKYYAEYTDGRLVPMLKIGEFGLVYVVSF